MASRSGRAANMFSRRCDPINRCFGRCHARLYARGGGRRFTKIAGNPVFRLTVRGRRSGEPRSVMLILTRRGDDILVCGSNGGNPRPPPWYLNLRHAGEADVHVGADTWKVSAREPRGDEREECWQILNDNYPDFASYQELTARQLPVVVLERAPGD